MPDPERLVAWRRAGHQMARHGVVPWWCVFLRHVQCGAASGIAPGTTWRRGRGDGQPAAQHLRLPGSLRHWQSGIRRIRQCRRARHGCGIGMGARQHRPLRRRSLQRDDLRRVRRRRQSLHADVDARGARTVPSRHRAERCGGAPARTRPRRQTDRCGAGGPRVGAQRSWDVAIAADGTGSRRGRSCAEGWVLRHCRCSIGIRSARSWMARSCRGIRSNPRRRRSRPTSRC